MSNVLTLGISPCPNDTFIFDAWVNGKLEEAVPQVDCLLEDISTLNTMALEEKLDVVKVSFYAYGLLRDKYTLVHAGGALGRGCGPLLVARQDLHKQALQASDVTIAIPGALTTANLLMSLYQADTYHKITMRFEQIMPAVARGDVDAGVIIHEGRFTFQQYGLVMVEDLGAWWERTTGYPLPLGGIVARKALGDETAAVIERAVRASLASAIANPQSPLGFMKAHAQEMTPEVMQQHVDLYVNDFSRDYGKEGLEAIHYLLNCAERKGLLKADKLKKR